MKTGFCLSNSIIEHSFFFFFKTWKQPCLSIFSLIQEKSILHVTKDISHQQASEADQATRCEFQNKVRPTVIMSFPFFISFHILDFSK